MTNKPKILVILGPTASGKSDLAVRLAQWVEKEKIGGFSGAEIISADSRQVYKGLDIGTGKITHEEMQGVPHHLLDVADPHIRFTAMDWKEMAEKAIVEIASPTTIGGKQNKLPIICGGTGFYISALIDNLGFPDVKADTVEQEKLEARSSEELFDELKKLDPKRAATIDLKNKRRLARAIIIARELGSVPAIGRQTESKYDVLLLGMSPSGIELRNRINTRLIKHLEQGMIAEAERLHAPAPTGISLSYERMDELGLEYKYIAQYLQMRLALNDLNRILMNKIWQYSKRQMTWWKKDSRIKWFNPEEIERIEATAKAFLASESSETTK
jgi:tRNA dimethylallyltransferase